MQNQTNWTNVIAKVTGYAVVFLAVASFVLSYEALWTLALDSGVTKWLAWLWPLTLDFFVFVASMSILNRNLDKRHAAYAWSLTIVFTVLSIVFNAVHKGLPVQFYETNVKPWLPVVVFVLPPVAFVFSFHLLMEQIKDRLSQEGDTPDTQPLPAVQVGPPQMTNGQLLNGLLSPGSDTRQNEVSQVTKEPLPDDTLSLANEAKLDKVAERRERVLALINEGKQAADIAEMLGVHVRTIKRDIEALNGQIKT